MVILKLWTHVMRIKAARVSFTIEKLVTCFRAAGVGWTLLGSRL
jgi:hypothetical protein